MTTHPDQAALEGQCREILQQLAGFGDLRPGTLSHRYVKCGKKACHCAEPGDPGHGPIWSLTWHADGKTRTRSIPPEAVEETRAQLAEYKRLRAVVATLVEISTELCDVRLRSRQGLKKKDPAIEKEVKEEIATELDRMIGPGALDCLDFEAVETAARQFALMAVGRALAGRLNADHSDHKGAGLPCACGQEARHAGRREKTFTSLLGPLRLERAWYHCDGCGRGFAPRDEAFGLDEGALTPGALRAVGIAAGRVSFAESSELLRELAGLRIDPKTVERRAEALGREIAQDERLVIEPEPLSARTVYLGLDGTGVPMRKDQTAGRKGKQPDGSSRTREAKLATVWTAENSDKDGIQVRDKGSQSFNAAIETIATRDTDTEASPFAQRILRECKRRGFDDAIRQAILGDGAPWIWNFAEEHYPGAFQIVDIFQYAELRIMPSNLFNRLISGSSSPDFSA